MRKLSSPFVVSAKNDGEVVLRLYGRRHCHLCEDMLAVLEDLRGEHRFEIEVIDIDADPALAQKYNDLVPVLEAGGLELCHHFPDVAKVREYLSGRH